MIDRCICESRTFAEILSIAKEEQLTTIKELQEKKICGTGCELCLSYVRESLRTGQVSFDPNHFSPK